MILSGTVAIPAGNVTASLPVPFNGLYTAKITPFSPHGWSPVITIMSMLGSLDLFFSVPATDDALVDYVVNR